MIITVPDASARKTVKVEFLLPQRTSGGESINVRYLRSEIEKIAMSEGGATTMKAPVEGLWAKDKGDLEKDDLLSFFTVVDITGREQSIGLHLQKIKRELEEKFDQEEIFILVSEVQRI